MEKVTLYTSKNSGIKVSMKIYFNEDHQLIFDGYDIGTIVKDLMGDVDYEYYYTIEPNAVRQLAHVLGVNPFEKSIILQEIKKRFYENDAYSKFGDFMKKHKIKYNQFTWR